MIVSMPRLPRFAGLVGSIAVLALPSLATVAAPEPAARAAGEMPAKSAVTSVGPYRVWVEPQWRHTRPRPVPKEGGPVLELALRIAAHTREDFLRFQGLAGEPVLTDNLGRKLEVNYLSGRPFLLPLEVGPLSRDPLINSYLLRFALPDDRAAALRSVEGELTFDETKIHQVTLPANELAGEIEHRLDEYTLKLEPVKSGEAETEVRLSLAAQLQGDAVTPARLEHPVVVVDLHDTAGRLYVPVSSRYSYSARGEGLSRSGRGFHTGQVPIRLSNAFLAALRMRGAPKPGEPLLPAPDKDPRLPAEATTHFETTLKFDPIASGEALKSLTVYLLPATARTKTVPFRISNVPLPLPRGQAQP